MPRANPATSAARGVRTAPARVGGRRGTGSASRAARPRPHGVAMRLPISRVRWDRIVRTVMLVVLTLVGYLGVKGMVTLISTRAQAAQQQAIVQALARQNRHLEQVQQSLRSPATIIRDARSLGMVRGGERSYVVTGLPGQASATGR